MPTRTVPFLPAPAGLGLLSAGARDAQRTAVAKALALDLDPVLQRSNGLERRTLHIPPGLLDRVEAFSADRDLSFQDAWAGLARAGFSAMAAEAGRAQYHVESAPDAPFQVREGQAGQLQTLYWRSVIASLRRDRIVIAEGSTGLGKGRVLVASALEKALSGVTTSPVRPVLIAGPTLKVVSQLWSEYEALAQEQQRWNGLRVRFMPGITEFADPLKVQQYLLDAQAADDPVDPAVQAWWEGGGKPGQDAPLVRALLAAHPEMNFLADDLRAMATQVEPRSLLLDPEDRDDPRVRVAREQARNAHVLFCTHAMIAWMHRSRWAGWDAPPQCLIIDEAHEFERAVAQANTSAVALRALRRNIAGAMTLGQVSKKAAQEARRAIIDMEQSCQQMLESQEDEVMQIRIAGAPDHFGATLDRLRKILAKKAYSAVSRIQYVREDLRTAADSLTNPIQMGWVEYSPHRAFPSIVSGRQSLGGVLGSLWSQAERGAVLASATLSVPDASGRASADYLVDVMHLPKSRTDLPPSVILPAVLDIPILHLPSERESRAVSRPARKARDAAAEAKWLSILSLSIARIVSRPSIRGGTLVLLTSHTQVQAVAEVLCDKIGAGRVIAAQGGERFVQTQARFEAAYRSGCKPVLLGVGPAWTGLDLSDKSVPAAQDWMLTDLILGCLPVGLNRTATMQARVERTGTHAVSKEALMMLRQGLGRLIRRLGVTDRHIWVLDGRLWTSWPGMESFTAAARKILEGYRHKAGMSVS